MLPRMLAAIWLLVLSLMGSCAGASGEVRQESHIPVDDGGGSGDSVSPRILVLIARGQFAEAQVLIQESLKGGLMSQASATALLVRIQLLNTKLGEIPARLQRVANFPSVLKDFTLYEIRTFLEQRDYSIATEAQLKMAKKLIEESPRLMEKIP